MNPDASAARSEDIPALMARIGAAAKAAAVVLVGASAKSKDDALRRCAAALRDRRHLILAANGKDMAAGEQKGLTKAMLDRLALDDGRIEAMASGLEAIAGLADPVGEVMAEWDRPNGLRISRVRVPLGVIGVIYESRPNVTADAGALCLKSGNAAILRCGSESFLSSAAIIDSLSHGLAEANLPIPAIQLVPTRDRAAVGEMLSMTDYIDVIVPRGGKSLISRVSAESKVPLFKHLEGICHTYVDAAADLETARKVVVNAKMRRPGICGAIDHIARHSTRHTDAIITEDEAAAEEFLGRVDSAIVMVNASTQYADGGEFGMGAEIGISTGKLHARGPVGVEQLTSFKYVVRGTGQCRP